MTLEKNNNIVNPFIFNSLLQSLGEDGLKPIIQEFIAYAPEQVSNLHTYIDTLAHNDIHKEAHSIKGSASNLGFSSLAEYCQQLESAANNEDSADYSRLLSSINTAFNEIKSELSKQNLI